LNFFCFRNERFFYTHLQGEDQNAQNENLQRFGRICFESPPVFNASERKKFFTLPARLSDVVETLRTPTNKVCFVLVAGYFRSRRKFFSKQFNQQDVEFITGRFGFASGEINLDSYDKQTFARHQQMILDYFGFRRFEQEAEDLTAKEITKHIRSQLRPKLILLEVIQMLGRRKIAVPIYNILANLIVKETNRHKRNLIQIIERELTPEQRELLDALFEKDVEEEETAALKVQRYRVTLLKKSYQSTKPAKIKSNLSDLQLLRGLYLEFEPVIAALGLSHEGLRYYANSIIKAEIFQVTRRAAQDSYLHLLCFIAHQTFRLQDALVDTLLQAVQTALNTVQREHKERYYSERKERNQKLKETLKTLDEHLLSALHNIQMVVANKELSDSEKLIAIAALLKEQEPQRDSITALMNDLKNETATFEQETDYYILLGKKSLKLQSRVSEIVRQSIFDSDSSSLALLEAINHFQEKGTDLDGRAPFDFLSDKERASVFDKEGKFQISIYKVLLFTKTANAIKAGTLNLTHSHKYLSLEDYLLPQEDWKQNCNEYLKQAELETVSDYETTTELLVQTLEGQYRRANSNRNKGCNPLLKFRPDGTFHVSTPKEDETDSLSLTRFFPKRKYVSLLEVLSVANRATSFLNEFDHWKLKYQRSKPSDKTFFAGIVGYGCDIGQNKIAQISKQINESELENTINWYFSLESLHAANDRILSVLDRMELPEIYRRNAEKLHTSSDGQKFETAVESLNANYSFKYFGQSKGVTVYSFIDERHLLFHSTVISSAEREAAYVIDGLMHNDVVQSDIHSTDTHGYSEIIFGVTHLLGFTFAPRIKHLGKQTLYSFEKRKLYQELGHEILPDATLTRHLYGIIGMTY